MTTLTRGSKGADVAHFQAMLCLAGIDVKPIDGDFGPGTERATQKYQNQCGMPATGVADLDTRESAGMNKPDATANPTPIIDQVSVDMVVKMFPRATPRDNIETYLPAVLSALAEADMDDCDLVLMALGTIRAETEGFEPISERKSKYNTDPGEHPFNRYDNHTGLGNMGKPDGDRFRGRGFIQLTGRSNYEKYGAQLGLGSQLVSEPELANSPEIAAKILASFIHDKRRMAKYALLGGDLATARRLVNGGSHGLERFTATFETGRQLLNGAA